MHSESDFIQEKERRFLAEIQEAAAKIAAKYEMNVDVRNIDLVDGDFDEDYDDEENKEFKEDLSSRLENLLDKDNSSIVRRKDILNQALDDLKASGEILPTNFLGSSTDAKSTKAKEEWITARIESLLEFSDIEEMVAHDRSLLMSFKMPHGFLINTEFTCKNAKDFNLEKARDRCFRSAVKKVRKYEDYIDTVKEFMEEVDEEEE